MCVFFRLLIYVTKLLPERLYQMIFQWAVYKSICFHTFPNIEFHNIFIIFDKWREKAGILFFLTKNYLPDFLIMPINNVHYREIVYLKSNHNAKSNKKSALTHSLYIHFVMSFTFDIMLTLDRFVPIFSSNNFKNCLIFKFLTVVKHWYKIHILTTF